jgi:hypothetical protein
MRGKWKSFQQLMKIGTMISLSAAGAAVLAGGPGLAQTWVQTTTSALYWTAVASAANGETLIGVVDGGDIYTSTNGGTTWTSNGLYMSWRSVAASADGTRLVAAGGGYNTNYLLTSTNSGFTWTSNTVPSHPSLNSPSIASSGDGMTFAAGSGSTYIFISTNSGITWFSNSIPSANQSVALSADGTQLFAATAGPIYASTNLGETWSVTRAPNSGWFSLAASADGTKLVAAGNAGIYTSTDSGSSWQSNAIPGSPYTTVACSAAGTTWAVANQFSLFVSTNAGATWTSYNAPATNWWGVAVTADGGQLVAIPAGKSPIWLGRVLPQPPRLNITPAHDNLAFSWIIPSTNFVLQQNLDLTTTNWADVTNPPVLNLTNLQEGVTLPLPADNRFYRLATQ